MGSTDVQRMPSSKLKIKTVYFCQVDGCKSKLSNCKPYCVRYRVCPAHLAAAQVQLQGETSRFCQQCGKFHAIEEFDGNKRSCRTRLMHHNNSRQQRRKEAALQQSASTTLMLQHTGVRAAPGRRNTQPPAAAEDTAAAAAGSEPSHTMAAYTASAGCMSDSGALYSQTPAAAAASGLQRRWPSHLPAALLNSKAPAAALAAAAAAAAGAGSQGILHGHPERLAAGLQGAACFATAPGSSSSSAALHHIPGVPTSAGQGPPLVLPGVPVAGPADEHLAASAGCGVSHNMGTLSRIPADAAGCDVSLFAHAHSLSAEALQARLLAQMSAAAATAAAQQQQQQRQFITEAAERVAFAAAPEQQGQLQPSTPHTANPVFHGSSPMNGLAASAAFPAASAAAAAAAAAPASMWQPAVNAAPAIMDATPFPAAPAAPELLANQQPAAATGCVGGDSSAGPNACVRGAGDSFGAGPCVRGAGDSFGGFCDVLLGSGRGLHELLQSWSAEGEAGEEALEGLALLPEDVDML
ncbi:hypothetical protein OEZ85_005998 [Tetradesmus obliquus]|uniref:SBP-type domain-containing protein n=1 Tax=Tetradesmus obliquus TaxID=3088 RepID=A0ABY8UKK6_TETOB|nr:hypothetical protein OEZ85_005998 [Tetradesmus obliquus]